MKEYSFLNVGLVVNGTDLTGYDEGDDVITLARLGDSAAHKIGTDGEMSVSLSADRSGTATFRLMQTSLSNAFMSDLIAKQENGAFAPVSVQMKDVKGGDLGEGTSGYINKPSDMQRGTGVGNQEWVITVENLSFLHAGADTL